MFLAVNTTSATAQLTLRNNVTLPGVTLGVNMVYNPCPKNGGPVWTASGVSNDTAGAVVVESISFSNLNVSLSQSTHEE